MKRVALATALLLTGCASPAVTAPAATPPRHSPASLSASGPFNPTDVMFLQMMLAEYGPAHELLVLARERTRSEQVRTLAAAIEVTQADERAVMRDWLTAWQQPHTPDADPGPHAGHGGLPGDGSDEVQTLRRASAADFDRTFLNLLIGHQHRAVEYARMELSGGAHAGARELATRIEKSRSAQIPMMLTLVG